MREKFNEIFIAKVSSPEVKTDVERDWLPLIKEALFTPQPVEKKKKDPPKIQVSIVRNA